MTDRAANSLPTVGAFQAEAHAWLAANAAHAPRDYGPICPPDLAKLQVSNRRGAVRRGRAEQIIE